MVDDDHKSVFTKWLDEHSPSVWKVARAYTLTKEECQDLAQEILLQAWIYLGISLTLPWTWYLEIPAAIWVIGFVIFARRRHPQKAGEPNESLLHCSKESLRQVEHQIWLRRNVFWWYLLPSLLAIMTFFVHLSWQLSSDWWTFLATLSGQGHLGIVVNVVVYLVDRLAIRLDLKWALSFFNQWLEP